MRCLRFRAVCRIAVLFYASVGSWPALLQAQETYFVTYSHEMEEPGNLEIAAKSLAGAPKGGNPFVATAVEFENLNAADKALLEVVGHDTREDLVPRNSRAEKEHEVELKLILSSNFKGWNVSENFIAEKNLGPFSWEFGYALGTSRPLALKASPNACNFCRENFALGAELYGGLGERHSFGFSETSHYLAPVLAWDVPHGPSIRVSPTFGLNRDSNGFLFRFMLSYEIDQFVSRLRGQP